MSLTFRILAIDFVVLLLCVLGVYRVSEKAGFPGYAEQQGRELVVRSAESPFLQVGDTIDRVAGMSVTSMREIEFLCDEHSIGDELPVQVNRNGVAISVPVSLVRDYSARKIVLECFASVIYFVIGISVLLLQKREHAARIFHHLAISIGATILLTTGKFTVEPLGLGYGLEALFLLSYLAIPALFVHFTLTFPGEFVSAKRSVLPLSYIFAAVIGAWCIVAFFRVAWPRVDLTHYPFYDQATVSSLFYFTGMFLLGFLLLLRSFQRAKDAIERRKLRWIFFGIIVGTTTYIVLSILQRMSGRHLLDEQYTLLLSTIAPISFGVAIIRFKVFNIDFFITRSTAYALAIAFVFGVYLLFVLLLTPVLQRLQVPVYWSNVIGAFALALVFDPSRQKIQKLIDKKFFRVSYNFFAAQSELIEHIKFTTAQSNLAEIVTERIDRLIPVTKIGFFVVDSHSDHLRLLAHRNFDLLERRHIVLRTQDLKTRLELPVALSEHLEPGLDFEPADREVFERWAMTLVFPMLSAERAILGFLVLGKKRSGGRFLLEDFSLLTAVTAQAGLALERIAIGNELVLEHAESERWAELSQLKSFFVSSVSHDLKTPLTSIRLFAELMKDHPDLSREKELEYLSIIEGESDRLSRIITNVLDFAKIEKGTKEYRFERRDLNEIAADVVHTLEYQIKSLGFEVGFAIASEPLAVEADYDAVFDAAANLISNAMKFSPTDRKRISIETERFHNFAKLSVADAGFGIPPEEMDRIFDSFYRIDDPNTRSTGGAGIGLALVKHTMEAHHGKVEVTSVVGNGSNFALYFPIHSP